MPSKDLDETGLLRGQARAAASSASAMMERDRTPPGGILNGALGLRAGWGICLFFLVAALVGTVLFFGLFHISGRYAEVQREAKEKQTQRGQVQAGQSDAGKPLQLSDAALTEVAETGAVLLTALGLSLLEGRRFGVYGLAPGRLRNFVPGALIGLLAISLLIGLLAGMHFLVFDARLLHGEAVARYGAAWLGIFLLVGLFEEFLFRGYIQFTLTRGLLGLGKRVSPGHARRFAFWMAAVFWSALFSATHLANAGEDPFGLIMVFVAGLVFSYALWRTGSLWWGIGFHLTWDWGQSFLFGVPDSGTLTAGRFYATHPTGRTLLSGGTAGPEGSVFVLPVLLLVFLAIRLQPAGPLPRLEPETFPLQSGGSSMKPIS